MKEGAMSLDKDSVIFVAGHRGLAGSAVLRRLRADGFTRIVVRRRDELDLRDRDAVRKFMLAEQPRYVVDAAAKVGGIKANQDYPVEFLLWNLDIQNALIPAAYEAGVEKLLFLGSSCIYPKLAEQPIRECSLLTGALEPTNEAYAIAKIAGIRLCDAYRREYGARFISAMPTNLYGPGDNFDLATSHVVPALMRKAHEAKLAGEAELRVWGSGKPLRELMHADDLADACLFLLEHFDEPGPINVGTGEDLSIANLARMVADVVGFRGALWFDPSMPDGTPRKVLDVSRIKAMGWAPKVGLRDGLEMTYRWFLENRAGSQ